MVVVWHQAVGQHIERILDQVAPKLPQKMQIVFAFKENSLAIVASVIEMIVMSWRKVDLTTGHLSPSPQPSA
jgi:hypothetical protein